MSRRKNGKKVSQSNTIETKVATILESMNCYGDFWHCNPHQYTSSYFNRGKKKTAEEIWERDNQRKEQFQKMGYKFLCLWESDIRENPKIVRSKIKKNIRLDNQQ